MNLFRESIKKGLMFRKDKKFGKTLIGTPGKFDIINKSRGRRSKSQEKGPISKEVVEE